MHTLIEKMTPLCRILRLSSRAVPCGSRVANNTGFLTPENLLFAMPEMDVQAFLQRRRISYIISFRMGNPGVKIRWANQEMREVEPAGNCGSASRKRIKIPE